MPAAEIVTVTLQGVPGHNFETLLVDPVDAKLYLFSRAPGTPAEDFVSKVFVASNPEESNETPLPLVEIGTLKSN